MPVMNVENEPGLDYKYGRIVPHSCKRNPLEDKKITPEKKKKVIPNDKKRTSPSDETR